MRKFAITSAALAVLAFTPGTGLADTIVIEPEVESWVLEQPEDTVTIDGDIVVGASLPDDVRIIEVPKHKKYGYVVVNKKRVLIDRDTRKVIKVY